MSPTPVNPGDTEVGMVYFNTVMNKLSTSWTAVIVNLTGTAADADIAGVEIWRDDGDGTWEGTGQDTQIGSGIFSGGTVEITLGGSEPITTALSVNYYVVFDVASSLSTPIASGGASIPDGAFTAGKPVLSYMAISSGDISLPVELGSWSARSLAGSVELDWITESEVENQGFIIERASTSLRREDSAAQAGSATDWEEIASFVSHSELLGQGSTTNRTFYSFTDHSVNVGETHSYRLADVDYVSNITYHDDVNVTVRDADDSQQPESMSLNDAFPNPFNPLVNLGFKLEDSAELELSVYDVQGRLVKTIVQGYHNSGSYTFQWNGLNGQGELQSSGVYLVRLVSVNNHLVHKVTLLR